MKKYKKAIKTSWYKHPLTKQGVRYSTPILGRMAGYGSLGYLAGSAMIGIGQNIDENLPKTMQKIQTIDDKIGDAIVEIGKQPAEEVISIDKTIKNVIGDFLGVTEEQRQQNRNALGLKYPSYIGREGKNKEGKIAELTTQPQEFHYFKPLAENIAAPLLIIALGYGAIKGIFASGTKYLRDRRINKLVDQRVNKILEEKRQNES